VPAIAGAGRRSRGWAAHTVPLVNPLCGTRPALYDPAPHLRHRWKIDSRNAPGCRTSPSRKQQMFTSNSGLARPVPRLRPSGSESLSGRAILVSACSPPVESPLCGRHPPLDRPRLGRILLQRQVCPGLVVILQEQRNLPTAATLHLGR